MGERLSEELQAMVQIESALSSLEEEERLRVLQWAAAKFASINIGRGKKGVGGQMGDSEDKAASGLMVESYEGLADFYDALTPSSDADKALVGAYWIQFRDGASDVDSRAVNSQLKHLGHGVSNITRAFESLKAQKPALIMQTRKDGSTKQARKRYKVTSEGKKAIEKMFQNLE